MIAVLIAPALLVIAFLLIWRGWRGVPQFSEPHCKRCGYDLRGLNWTSDQRICPECGADAGRPGAVRYADYRRSPRRIVAGLVLIGLCAAGWFGEQAYRAYRLQRPSVQSNARLIANLKTSANSPWDWQELENRYNSGRLSGWEVASAIDQLIAYLKANPSSHRNPLPWSDRFIRLAFKGSHVSDEQLKRLCDVYYGSDPGIEMRTRIRQGRKLEFEAASLSPWDLPGMQCVEALRLVQMDGKPVSAVPRYGEGKSRDYLSCARHGQIDGQIEASIPAGEHQIVFEFDWGMLSDARPLTNRFDGRPGQAERWPKTLVRRVLVAKLPVHVLPPDVSPITLITDPGRDPSSGGTISVASIQVVAEKRGVSLRLHPQLGQPAVPVCFRMRAKAGGKECDLGWAGAYQGMGISSGGDAQIDSLPKDVREATVILEPAPDIAEESMKVDQIWGKPVMIEHVPLERYDLEDKEPPKPSTAPAIR